MSTILGDLGALAGGIAALGPLFGAGSSNDGSGLRKRALQQQMGLQARAYYSGIQDKVADAKAAGLHPLFALGGSGAQLSALPVDFPYSDSTETFRLASQGLRAMGRGMEGLSRRAVEARISKDEAEAQKAESEAAYWNQRALITADPFNQANPAAPVAQRIVTPYGGFTPGPWTSQQAVEDEFGGVVGEGYGVMKALDEARRWMNRQWPDPVGKAAEKAGLKRMKRRPKMRAPGVWR